MDKENEDIWNHIHPYKTINDGLKQAYRDCDRDFDNKAMII